MYVRGSVLLDLYVASYEFFLCINVVLLMFFYHYHTEMPDTYMHDIYIVERIYMTLYKLYSPRDRFRHTSAYGLVTTDAY